MQSTYYDDKRTKRWKLFTQITPNFLTQLSAQDRNFKYNRLHVLHEKRKRKPSRDLIRGLLIKEN